MALRLDLHHQSIIFYIGLDEDSEKVRVLRDLAKDNFDLIQIPASRIHSRLDDILAETLRYNKIKVKDKKFALRAELLESAEMLVADKNFELILFYNFDKYEISQVLKEFKELTNERISIKAALTEYNLTLSILALFRELFEEHTFIRNANLLNMGIKLSEFRFPKEAYGEKEYVAFSKVLSESKSYMHKISDPNLIVAGEEPKPSDPLKFFINLMLSAKQLDSQKYLGDEFQQRVFRDEEIKNLVDVCEKNNVIDDNIKLSNFAHKLIDDLETFENVIDEKSGAISNIDDEDFASEDFSTNPFEAENSDKYVNSEDFDLDYEEIEEDTLDVLTELLKKEMADTIKLNDADPKSFEQMIVQLKKSLLNKFKEETNVDVDIDDDEREALAKIEEAVEKLIKDKNLDPDNKWEKIKKESKSKDKKPRTKKVKDKLFTQMNDDEEFSPYGRGNSPNNKNS